MVGVYQSNTYQVEGSAKNPARINEQGHARMGVACPSIVLRKLILADFSTWQLDNTKIVIVFKERFSKQIYSKFLFLSE